MQQSRSAPFPYTTLFRSGGGELDVEGRAKATVGHLHDAGVGIGGGHARSKSTRLNSSHVSTSYAVFCWKQKKRTSLRWSVCPISSDASRPLLSSTEIEVV